MAEFYIGIDSGGTGTRARLWPGPGQKTVDFEAGPSNLCSSREEDVKAVFISLLQQIRTVAGNLEQCRGVGIGAAGIGSPRARERLLGCLRELLPPDVPVVLASDAQTALYGAAGDGPGMILIAGTGSVCLGKDRAGREYKAGGWGHLIDDEGSGYAIGRDILSAALRQQDGRGDATILTDLLAQELHLCSCGEIADYVYGSPNPKARIAAAAPLLIRGCAAGDGISRQIASRASRGLADLVGAVAAQLGRGPAVLAFYGGILRNMEPVADLLEQDIHREYPDLTITKTGKDALDGALYLIRKRPDR